MSVERIAIIGNAGAGKTTLARSLASARSLPLIEVDPLQWGPAWERIDPAEVATALRDAQAGPRWIVDGFGPMPIIEERMALADPIILIELPLWIHFWLSAERQIAMIARGERPFGERQAPSTELLFATIWRVHHELMPAIREAALAQRGRAVVHHVTSRDGLHALRRTLLGDAAGPDWP